MNKYQKGWQTRRRKQQEAKRKALIKRLTHALWLILILCFWLFGVIGGALDAKTAQEASTSTSTPFELPSASTTPPTTTPYKVKQAGEKPLRARVLELTRAAGIPDSHIETLLKCENRPWDPHAYYVNQGGTYAGTVDRGLFMINDYFHPQLSNEAAFDPIENTKYAVYLWKKTNSFVLWSCGKKHGI